MGKLGGRRPGAGRPKLKGTVLQQQAKNRLVNKVLRHWDPLVQTWVDLALGDYYIEETDKGVRRVYKAKPDSKSLKDLAEFVAGKPTQPIEMESEDMRNAANEVRDVGTMIQEILSKKKQEQNT